MAFGFQDFCSAVGCYLQQRSAFAFSIAAAVITTVSIVACGGGGSGGRTFTGQVQVQVMSSPANLVTGGSALVEVTVGEADPAPTVKLNGTDVSGSFQALPNRAGHYVGVVNNIPDGANLLAASTGDATDRVTLVSYPATGPVFSGPLQTPFFCQTSEFKLPDGSLLGEPIDANCSITPRVHYLYQQVGKTELVPLPSTASLPQDIANTTTTAGLTVPFVVRVETRTLGRGIYQSAVLHDPTTEALPSPLVPPRAWNRRLIAGQGVGCTPGWYVQGSSQGGTNSANFDVRLTSPARLGAGYAIFSNTLMYGSNSCNPILASEVAMMSKEHFVKTNGIPAFTVGIGCSGGSYGALQPADRIPGLYDGVLVLCVFADGLSSSIAGSDARLLARYLTLLKPAAFSEAQRAAITGYKGDSAMRAAALNSNRTDPVPGRTGDIAGYTAAQWSGVVSGEVRYNPSTNRSGARPTVYDTARNYLGIDRSTGFALRTYDNVGIQYGLQALNSGAISIDEFLDLNEAIGGFDQDANYTTARSAADVGAVTRAYQSGMILNGGAGLAAIPVVDATGIYDEDTNYHQQWQHFALRERLLKANGGLGNYVMLRGAAQDVPADDTMNMFFNWVQSSVSDTAGGTQRDKVLRNRPPTAVDGCYTAGGATFIPETPTLSAKADTPCNAIVPSWSFPRLVAGAPLSADILKCALKAPSTSGYAVNFSGTQWQRLLTIFPQGVCDWSKPGVGQTAVVANGSFGPAPDNFVFDITKQ
jgi:hypothetical protein